MARPGAMKLFCDPVRAITTSATRGWLSGRMARSSRSTIGMIRWMGSATSPRPCGIRILNQDTLEEMMEYRLLGGSGFKVPVLSFGAATFGGGNEFFQSWGSSSQDEANRIVDMCLDAGLTMFDTADAYSRGRSEEMLGKAIGKRRDKVIISTKSTFGMSDDPNDIGSSRFHIMRSIEGSLRRLNTDYIDIYTMHGFDALTPVEEVLSTLNDLVQGGKVRYLACSNFSGWHLMKSLAVSDKYGWSRYVAHQASYSLVGREYEWELMPLGIDQKVGTIVWSPLAGGRLSGKFRRDNPMPAGTRIQQGGGEGPVVMDETFFKLIDAL